MRTAVIFQLARETPEVLPALSAHLAAVGLSVARTATLPADRCPLEAALRRAAEGTVALVLTLGAAGAKPADIAPDALAAVVTRPLPGMAEALRAALPSPAAQLFRGQAGLRGGVLLVNLPPFPAAEAALAAILPAVKAYLSP
ncbi:MAG: molybdopterin-binding protein [Oscillibacter sp.]